MCNTQLNNRFGHATMVWAIAVCAGLVVPQQAKAQSDSDITLYFGVDDSISGTLIEFTGSSYKLDTLAGALTIPASDVACSGPACPDGVQISDGEPDAKDQAEADLTVVMVNGDLKLEGQFIASDDESYLVKISDLGEYRLSKSSFSCTGEGCPTD